MFELEILKIFVENIMIGLRWSGIIYVFFYCLVWGLKQILPNLLVDEEIEEPEKEAD